MLTTNILSWCSRWYSAEVDMAGLSLTAYHIYSEIEAASAMPVCLCKCLCVQTVDGHIVRTCPLALLHKTQSQSSGNTAIGTRAKEWSYYDRENHCSS